jgi:hypothetical protein
MQLSIRAVLVPLRLSNTSARTPSVPNLRGTCIWQEIKIPTSDQLGVGPATILASIHFGEGGAMTMDYEVNINGTYSSTNGVEGSYSVDSTGHGSFMFTSPASGYIRTYDFRVSTDGHTIYTIAQSDRTGSVTQRVSAGTCTFQEQDESRSDDRRPVFFRNHCVRPSAVEIDGKTHLPADAATHRVQ